MNTKRTGTVHQKDDSISLTRNLGQSIKTVALTNNSKYIAILSIITGVVGILATSFGASLNKYLLIASLPLLLVVLILLGREGIKVARTSKLKFKDVSAKMLAVAGCTCVASIILAIILTIIVGTKKDVDYGSAGAAGAVIEILFTVISQAGLALLCVTATLSLIESKRKA